ncbi:hypothetical protein A9Q81_27570 [Gammaproteobacteria bacterium 42_54_T18]|nr:hypothetical protein A9Q81_27570 [Gammaproteobacteria bacterium 42_54_T18]
MFLIHPSKEEINDGLEAWGWLDFSGKEPFAVTAFGDVFFDANDGVYFLDKVSGELEPVCDTKKQLEEILNSADGQDHFLMSELVLLAREHGLILGYGECYEFKILPMLNGEMVFDNLQKMDFKVSLHIAGQIIGQVKDFPEGTQIEEVKLGNS